MVSLEFHNRFPPVSEPLKTCNSDPNREALSIQEGWHSSLKGPDCEVTPLSD